MRALMPSTQGAAPVALPTLALTISADQISGYNIATHAGVAVATQIVLTIKPAIKVKVLTTGTFPAGSRLKIINKGVVYGPGGNGGAGANATVGGATGATGAVGGDALVVSASSGLALIEIDNGAGYVLAGGGGGKGGDANASGSSYGAGGGGGAGVGSGGAHGTGGTSTTPTNGAAGGKPTWTGATWANLTNAGGAGGTGPSPTQGHNGCDWGTAGLTGDGAPGKAVALNGGSVTFLAGGTAPNVKGAIA